VPDPPEGLRPADPREWVTVWRRAIADPSVKLTGFAVASFADYRTGARIHPGVPLLMKVTGLRSDKSVRDALKLMRDDWGLIWRYAEGSKRGRAKESDEYRLTFPDDITVIPLMDPDWEMPDPDGCGQPPDHR
jgi:hypothetical protein